MKRTKLIFAPLVACLLSFGGVSNVSAQEPGGEEIEFGIDYTQSDPGASKTPILVPTVWLIGHVVLYQNTPNPFKEQTTIRFRLADDAQNAAICIFDMSGKMLKKLPVSQGTTSVTVNGYELGEGLYLVNGKEIDTKRMILSK